MDLKDVKNLLTINKSVLKLLMMRQMDEANTRDCNIQGGCKRSEVVDISFIFRIVVFTAGYIDGMSEIADINPTQAKGDVDTGSQKENNQPGENLRCFPDIPVSAAYYSFQRLKKALQ